MTTMSVGDAATQLKRLIDEAAPGDEIVLTENDRIVARLIPVPQHCKPRVPGTAKGQILYMADDFFEPMELVPASTTETCRGE